MIWTVKLLLAISVGFFVSFGLTPLARRLAHGARLIDVPNERSSHAVPTPRTGGFAILLAILAGSAVDPSVVSDPVRLVLVAAVLLAALSIYDDLRPLPRHFRLFAQIILTFVVLTVGRLAIHSVQLPFLGDVDLGIMAIPLCVFWIVGLTNAFNFMDGINGIASLEAIICGATLAAMLASGGDVGGAILALVIVGAAAGFLPWNLGGTIFMGDVGSASLGFLLGFLVLRTARVAPAVAAILPLAPFLFDSGITLIARAMRGERFFSTPHRSHFYQRLVSSGFSHVTVSLVYASLALLSSLLALVYGEITDAQRISGILALILVHATVATAAVRLESRRKIAPV
jgi:UDP-GlcNAc:undecaprenyl-phosphate GlcNAc-1-phosphate transferase